MPAPKPIVVTLRPDEWHHAIQVGSTRQIDNLRGKKHDRYGCAPEDGWAMHIDGALGEKAVAKHMGLYWSGNLGNHDAPDVGLDHYGIQVRTARGHNRRLIVQKADKDGHAFVLVTYEHTPDGLPDFLIRGWMMGRQAKREEWWQDPTGKDRWAFFAPTDELRPLAEMERRVHQVALEHLQVVAA